MTNALKSVILVFLFMVVSFCSISGRGACWFGCDEPAYACGGVGVVKDASAAQNAGARLCLAAEMVLASCVLNTQGQLPGRNAPRAENDADHRCKKCAFDGVRF